MDILNILLTVVLHISPLSTMKCFPQIILIQKNKFEFCNSLCLNKDKHNSVFQAGLLIRWLVLETEIAQKAFF